MLNENNLGTSRKHIITQDLESSLYGKPQPEDFGSAMVKYTFYGGGCIERDR